ncbi:MAG: hypothetical protein ABI353_10160, partial [Isosphaeraceae bacterium]
MDLSGRLERKLDWTFAVLSAALVRSTKVNVRVRIGLLWLLALTLPWPARAQVIDPASGLPDEEKVQSPAAQRFRELTGAEGLEKQQDREKTKPPFEFFRSQIAPFDVLPYVKPGHWNTLSLELRANHADFVGLLQSSPVLLNDRSHAVVYRRDARLAKGQDSRLSQQMMLPQPAKEMVLELTKPGAIRAEGAWEASLLRLEPHQMLIAVLANDPSVYASWTRLNALIPSSGDKDLMAIDKQRYYRLVLPQKPEKPALSPHPLTWTTISHLVWDGQEPETLGIGQQGALIDWLHWGGQLVVMAAGPGVASLQDSFLGPYLPATLSGSNAALRTPDLSALSVEYLPPVWPGVWEESNDFNPMAGRPPRYAVPAPIAPAATRPVLFVGLKPKPGATPLALPGSKSRLMGVECRVGRGRVLMLAFNPLDPAFAADAWPGMDTFVRRVVLRRSEEVLGSGADKRFQYAALGGPDLTWVRYLARDLGVGQSATSAAPSGDLALPTTPVAAWNDTASELPMKAREALGVASGISIPAASFVLKVMLAYLIALVPLNWLICRFVLGKKEWAWALVPVLALGFAVVVERAAAYDLGFDSACDEIDLLEVQGGYSRAHLSRFAAIYSTGRDRYSIAYPDDPSALALPLNMERQLRGEEAAQSVWQSSPEPALVDLLVQPRSLMMYRAEAMVDLGGVITLQTGENGVRQVVNQTPLELRDAVLIDLDEDRQTPLGTILPGASAGEDRAGNLSAESAEPGIDWVEMEPFLKRLRTYRFGRPEDAGEIRLVAWAAKEHPGQSITPKVDRHRGFRLVVVHLRHGAPPNPAAAPYYSRGGPLFATDLRRESYDDHDFDAEAPGSPEAPQRPAMPVPRPYRP